MRMPYPLRLSAKRPNEKGWPLLTEGSLACPRLSADQLVSGEHPFIPSCARRSGSSTSKGGRHASASQTVSGNSTRPQSPPWKLLRCSGNPPLTIRRLCGPPVARRR
jgi:hypothetical protein